MTNRASSSFKAPAAPAKLDAQFELVERVLPDFVLAVLRAHGVCRLAAGMECRTFGASALQRLAFATGSMPQALEYRSAVVVLKDKKIVAQGFQRVARAQCAVVPTAEVATAQPVTVSTVSAPVVPTVLPPPLPFGENTLRLPASKRRVYP